MKTFEFGDMVDVCGASGIYLGVSNTDNALAKVAILKPEKKPATIIIDVIELIKLRYSDNQYEDNKTERILECKRILEIVESHLDSMNENKINGVEA